MPELNARARAADPGGMSVSHPRALGEELNALGEQFSQDGALGVILVDASALSEIERVFGGDAQNAALRNLASLVEERVSERLGVADRIVTGETGRSEVLVLVFREANEAGFYKRELPELTRRIVGGLAKRGHRVGYPHVKRAPSLPVGSAAQLRNPTVRAETQIRRAVEDARADAELARRVGARRRRSQILELLLEGAITSVYEPIVDVATRTVFGYEALSRGPAESELYSAAALFESAREEDLLFQLDCLCRERGLDGARDFPEGAKLFLNVRPTAIHDPNFRAEALRRTLAGCDLSPSDVVLEISEQESISSFEIFREVRDHYGKLGFQIAMDDVGAGYSSLEAVMELSPEFLKVDRAFVAGIDEDPARQELLRALHAVANQIGARIIGEGLDTLEELETLGRLEIPFGQGWLFGKPHPLRADS